MNSINILKNPFRLVTWALLELALFLSITSLFFQFVKHLEPCPLCILQRISVFSLTFLCLWALFIKKKTTFIINNSLQLLFALFGAAMASRQIWLIHVPSVDRAGCMPDISILWNYLPFLDILKIIFNGTGDCIEHPWIWLGITMPEWTLGFFIIFALVITIRFFKNPFKKNHPA